MVSTTIVLLQMSERVSNAIHLPRSFGIHYSKERRHAFRSKLFNLKLEIHTGKQQLEIMKGRSITMKINNQKKSILLNLCKQLSLNKKKKLGIQKLINLLEASMGHGFRVLKRISSVLRYTIHWESKKVDHSFDLKAKDTIHSRSGIALTLRKRLRLVVYSLREGLTLKRRKEQ